MYGTRMNHDMLITWTVMDTQHVRVIVSTILPVAMLTNQWKILETNVCNYNFQPKQTGLIKQVSNLVRNQSM